MKSVKTKCLDRKATDRSFLNRYIYPTGRRRAIETNMAITCFNEFMQALISNGTVFLSVFFFIKKKEMKVYQSFHRMSDTLLR